MQRSTSRVLIAAVAIVGALTMTACGSDPTENPPPTGVTPPESTRAPDLPPQPTPEELNAQFQRALDPAVPVEEKVGQVQGAEADPGLVNQFVEAARAANVTASIESVEPFGTNELQATGTLTISGQPNVITVDFVPEDGRWKLKKDWVCAVLGNLGQQSPACA